MRRYHKEWDSHCKELRTIQREEGSDVIYWDVSYPWPLSSRDYVYRRMSVKKIDDQGKECFLTTSKACTHQECPETKKAVRVFSFESDFCFRPRTNTCCEFVYQFHEDPRGTIPKTVVNWFVSRGLPGVMKTLYSACDKRAVSA